MAIVLLIIRDYNINIKNNNDYEIKMYDQSYN